MKDLIFLVMLLLSTVVFVGCQNSNNLTASSVPSAQNIGEEAIVVSIEVSQSIKLKDQISVKWKMTNGGEKPIFLYSSLIKQPYFVETSIDSLNHTIEIRFTRLSTMSASANYFPPPEFQEIGIGQSLGGNFISGSAASGEVSYQSAGKLGKASRISEGEWRVRTVFAYGTEIDSVQSTLTDPKTKDEHPVNSIVRWQKLAYSEFKPVEFVK